MKIRLGKNPTWEVKNREFHEITVNFNTKFAFIQCKGIKAKSKANRGETCAKKKGKCEFKKRINKTK